ncbi:hypothetical protein [Bacillus sp. B1-b2]|uniref:hypothetical protein n=1 Tax=Bacillus sp. B1-b2 TaxID=2653201 RepID=UPI001261ED06|nr:hypothetical protein [Bacillus sp. B1-b2]KAB7668424.1 hypothetical protein F9279_13480 [Bacillus sp. B1-b2]
MIIFLIISEVIYVASLLPWLIVFGLSFMSFDNGVGFTNIAFVGGIGLYPVAVLICSILGWVYRLRKTRILLSFIVFP